MNLELEELHQQQIKTFELAHKNFDNLNRVIYRSVTFDDFEISIQYNPDRIVSTNAKIDKATLSERKCFLCRENMPADQQGIAYGEKYHIYINPYPIFKQHFTVPANLHSPQLINGHFEDMLSLAYDYQGYTIFYNGPQCGASAPDHFHFQIAPRHIMPLEKDVEDEKIIHPLIISDYHTILTSAHYLRKCIVLKASDQQLLVRLFQQTVAAIGQLVPYAQEPMFNLLTWFDNCQWTVCLLPRKLLRPWQFFAEGNDKILFSPGCVDMAGLIIAPRKEDFERYDQALLHDLFGQVTITDEDWEKLKTVLKSLQ